MLDKKKMLVYAHYYYPDIASTGQIIAELCEGLKEQFDITIICVVPSYSGKIEEKYKTKRTYKEEKDGIKIVRVRVREFDKKNKISRIKNILGYFFNSIIETFKLGQFDYIYSISQPPILGGVLGIIGKIIKRAKFIYNIQDFNPEQTMAVGYSKNKVILKIAMGIDKLSCRFSDKVIVVGRDMQETLKDRFKNKKVPKNTFINNWIDEKKIFPLIKHSEVERFKEKYDLDDKFIIMYSGNIGLYYDLENIIKVLGEFKEEKEIIFAFVGDGTVKNNIEEYVLENKIENIKFIPYQDKEYLNYSLNSADVHLVVNAKGIKGISVPSKLYGVMAAGKPVLAVLEENSEARLIIEESDCGICSSPGKYNEIKKNIKYILENKELMKIKGLKGREYIESKLTKDISIKKYSKEILEA